eukprot:jgi/Galph1/5580/GphlegSOOS_G4239.1
MQFFGKLIGKEHSGLGYSLGNLLPGDGTGIWKIYEGKNKETNEAALVFVREIRKEEVNSSLRTLARTGVQRLKTLRHPNILKFYNSVETESMISFATEAALPFKEYITRNGPLSVDAIYWGLYCLARALEFLHNECKLVHGRICSSTVFITPSGDWKLGGLEASVNDPSLLRETAYLQEEKYRSPELVKEQWKLISQVPIYVVDAWALGCFVQEVFSGGFRSVEQLRQIDSIPKPLLSDYQKLLASNPTNRLQPSQLLESKCIIGNTLVDLSLFLEKFDLKELSEKEEFLTKISDMAGELPKPFLRYKVVPTLCASIEFGGGGVPVLNCLSAIVKLIPDDEFKKALIRQHVTKWYAEVKEENRIFRIDLVNKLELFAPFMEKEAINKIVLPFIWVSPALRDTSVKAVIHIVAELDEKRLNSVLMGHFSKIQLDPEPAIRTNTTVCLGKIASYLTEATRNKVLIPAFSRALKDPFPPARTAGLVSLMKTTEYYQVTDIARKVLPAVVPCLVDEDKESRLAAFECLECFLAKVRHYHGEVLSKSPTEYTSIEENATSDRQKTTSKPSSLGFSNIAGWNFSSLATSIAQLSGSIADGVEDAPKPNLGGPSSRATQQYGFAGLSTNQTAKHNDGLGAYSYSQQTENLAKSSSSKQEQPPDDSQSWDLLVDFSEPLPYDNYSNTTSIPKAVDLTNQSKPLNSKGSRKVAGLSQPRPRTMANTLDQIVTSNSNQTRKKQAKDKAEEEDDWSALLGGPELPSTATDRAQISRITRMGK